MLRKLRIKKFAQHQFIQGQTQQLSTGELSSYRFLTAASILLAYTNKANTFLSKLASLRISSADLTSEMNRRLIRNCTQPYIGNMHQIGIVLECGSTGRPMNAFRAGLISVSLVATPTVGGPIAGLSTRAFIHTVTVLRLGLAASASLRRRHTGLIFLGLPGISGVRVIAARGLSVAARSDTARVGGTFRECT
jgi:hypothetical protein